VQVLDTDIIALAELYSPDVRDEIRARAALCVLVGIDGARLLSHAVGTIEANPVEAVAVSGFRSIMVALLVIAEEPEARRQEFLRRVVEVFETAP
jgi:hypothetical protein